VNEATVVAVSSHLCVVKSYKVDKFELTVFDENTAVLAHHAEQDTMCGRKAVPP
jgi:hypothetical protein